jgi:hypothetical protein
MRFPSETPELRSSGASQFVPFSHPTVISALQQ